MFRLKAAQAIRQFSNTAVLRKKSRYVDTHEYKGPGSTLPFNVFSKYKFTLYFTLFMASGYSLPFLMIRYIIMRSG